MLGKVRFTDTSDEAGAVQLAIHRRLGPDGRLALAIEMSDEARTCTEAGVRCRHPEFSDRDVRRELIRVLYGLDLDVP